MPVGLTQTKNADLLRRKRVITRSYSLRFDSIGTEKALGFTGAVAAA
jgi:hypothetical protein